MSSSKLSRRTQSMMSILGRFNCIGKDTVIEWIPWSGSKFIYCQRWRERKSINERNRVGFIGSNCPTNMTDNGYCTMGKHWIKKIHTNGQLEGRGSHTSVDLMEEVNEGTCIILSILKFRFARRTTNVSCMVVFWSVKIPRSSTAFVNVVSMTNPTLGYMLHLSFRFHVPTHDEMKVSDVWNRFSIMNVTYPMRSHKVSWQLFYELSENSKLLWTSGLFTRSITLASSAKMTSNHMAHY